MDGGSICGGEHSVAEVAHSDGGDDDHGVSQDVFDVFGLCSAAVGGPVGGGEDGAFEGFGHGLGVGEGAGGVVDKRIGGLAQRMFDGSSVGVRVGGVNVTQAERIRRG